MELECHSKSKQLKLIRKSLDTESRRTNKKVFTESELKELITQKLRLSPTDFHYFIDKLNAVIFKPEFNLLFFCFVLQRVVHS